MPTGKTNGSQPRVDKPTDPELELAAAEAELLRAVEEERRQRFPDGLPDTLPDLSG